MAMYCEPSSASPKSKTEMVWMCESRETIRASATKRSTAALSRESSRRMSFSAITFPIRTCSTLNTAPMPPSPSFSRRRYRSAITLPTWAPESVSFEGERPRRSLPHFGQKFSASAGLKPQAVHVVTLAGAGSRSGSRGGFGARVPTGGSRRRGTPPAAA